MPMLFFFDTDDGERRLADHAGTELSGEAEALDQAMALLRDLSHAGAPTGGERAFAVRLRGADGEGLYEARLVLAVESLRRG